MSAWLEIAIGSATALVTVVLIAIATWLWDLRGSVRAVQETTSKLARGQRVIFGVEKTQIQVARETLDILTGAEINGNVTRARDALDCAGRDIDDHLADEALG